MNAHENERPEPNEPVADRNVERLLEKAYRPADPDPAFVARLGVAMQQVAREEADRRAAAAPPPPIARPASPAAAAPAGRLSWGLVAATALLGAGLILSAWTRDHGPTVREEGALVWIDGKAYRPADGRFVEPAPTGAGAAPLFRPRPTDVAGVTPRPRPEAPALERVAAGATIATAAGERRRIGLPDGSVLYLNEQTRVTVDADRRVALAQGELFVEVAPRAISGERERFVVTTGARSVTALGTKFGVRREGEDARVLVTQGKVALDGLAAPIPAGSQVRANADATAAPAAARIEPAPRASHVLDWTRDLMAAAESPLVPGSEYRGGALVAVDPFGQQTRLTLRRYHVDVHIEDGFARTTIDQTYFNHEWWRTEGTFYFPLPADASLSRLAMYVGGTLMEGGMSERDRARAVYEQILHQSRDPALLEWMDGSTFKMRVFPIEGRQEKRIILSYTQRLADLYGRTTYRFPAGHDLGLVRDWSLAVRVRGGAGARWESAQHALSAATEGEDLVLAGEERHATFDRDVVLHIDAPVAASAVGDARFASAVHEGQRYLMMRWRPSLPTARDPQQARAPRHWILLFEASADRDPILARAAADVVRALLQNAEHDDTFSLMTAGTRLRALSDGPLPVTQQSIAQAAAFLDATHLIGALDLGAALDATAPLAKAAGEPVLVHVGSGIPVLGERDEKALLARLPGGARYVGVGIGKRWARAFMREAAARTGGCFTRISPDEPVAWRAFELASAIDAPGLAGLTISAAGGKVDFLTPQASVRQGEELCAVARLPEGAAVPEHVTVQGTLDGEPFRQRIALADLAEGAGYLPRFWARLEIDRLLTEDAEKNREAIVKLSMASYVMSPFTSLLVLENEKMYEEFGVDRGRTDHWARYPAPEQIEVVREAPDPRTRRPIDEVPGERRTRDAVLQTVMVRIHAPVIVWPNDPYQYRQILSVKQLADGVLGHGQVWGGSWGSSWRSYRGGQDWYRAEGQRRLGRWAVQNELLETAGERLGKTATLTEALDMTIASGEFLPRGEALRASFVDDLGLTSGGTGLIVGDRIELARALEVAPTGRVSGLSSELGLALRDARVLDGTLAFDEASNMRGAQLGQSFFAFSQLSSESRATGRRRADLRERDVLGRLVGGMSLPNLHYQRPQHGYGAQSFGDLLAFAPGLNTIEPDVRAVLDREARPEPGATSGTIDPAAAALIERARRAGWQRVTVPATGAAPAFDVVFDGRGRFAWERTLANGLFERVACDGQTLLHLYPELGLAARRPMSRFHRALLQRRVPWALAPAEELARGADVTLLDERTVAIAPRGVDEAPSEGEPKDGDAAEEGYLQLELRFAEDGRLAERRVVRRPDGEVLLRETFAADGRVTARAGDRVEDARTVELALRAADAPQLAPATGDLVVLPMPVRARAHVWEGIDEKRRGEGYAALEEDEALALLASDLDQHGWDAVRLLADRWIGRGDHRLGFYVLFMATNVGWQDRYHLGGDRWLEVKPLAHHAGSPVAHFIEAHRKVATTNRPFEIPEACRDADGLVGRLAPVWALTDDVRHGRQNQGSDAEQRAWRRRALEAVERAGQTELAWAAFSAALAAGGNAEEYAALAEAAGRFERHPALAGVARYERARCLLSAGRQPEARAAFRKIWDDAIAADRLARIDSHFRSALESETEGAFAELIRATADGLRERGRWEAPILLAWQCHQVGDPALAEELLQTTLLAVPEEHRHATTLAAVEVYWHSGQPQRAEPLLEQLLAGEGAKSSTLWRLAAAVAEQIGRPGRAFARLEKALDMEYADLPAVVNLQALRADYGTLLAQYAQMASALATLDEPVPPSFVARVVRTADRWRALETEPQHPCQAAANVLQLLGEDALAWDYLTSPLAARPGESAAWLQLAQVAEQWSNPELAVRAYATAFDAERTNAQILWSQAQLLQRYGRQQEALEVYRTIAEGDWQPRFQWLQTQARRYLAGR